MITKAKSKKNTQKAIIKNTDPLENNKDESSRILKALSKNPTYRLPSKGFKGFSEFDPIEDDGIPASELLIRDRR